MTPERAGQIALSTRRSAWDTARARPHGAIPFHRTPLGREEEEAVVRALKTGVLQGNGPIGRAVEAQLSRLLEVRHALLMGSCTAALEATLAVLDVAGDEVILPSFSFPATAAAIVGAGARPVFVDIEPMGLGLDPARAAQAISARTRAILYVAYGGNPGSLGAIRELADRRGLPLIEDAAQALGSRWRGRPLGSCGTVGNMSFHETKIVTCGEGGLLTTDDDRLAHAALINREYGTNRAEFCRGTIDHYEWVGRGSSRLLAEPLAALLQAQLNRLPAVLARRRTIADRYLQAFTPLGDAKLVQLPVEAPEARLNWHTFYLLVHDRQTADGLIEALAQRGIDARRHFSPLHQSAYAKRCGYTVGDCPVTESVAGRLIRLPIYPTLTDAQQERVIDGVCRGLRSRSAVRSAPQRIPAGSQAG